MVKAYVVNRSSFLVLLDQSLEHRLQQGLLQKKGAPPTGETPPKKGTPPPKAGTPPPKTGTPPPKAGTPPPKAGTPTPLKSSSNTTDCPSPVPKGPTGRPFRLPPN